MKLVTLSSEEGTVALSDVLDAARQVDRGPGEEWPFRAAAVGERLEAELADPVQLADVSRRVINIAHRAGCTQLLGASLLGERIAAAAVALDGNDLRTFSLDQPGERVLIVDGTLASGAQISKAARRAHLAGAAHAVAAVAVALNGRPDFLREEIEDLFVLLDS